MSNHNRYMIALLAAMVSLTAASGGQVTDSTSDHAPIPLAQTVPTTGLPRQTPSAQIQTAAQGQSLLQLPEGAQTSLAQAPQAFNPSTDFDLEESKKALLKQLDEAQKRLVNARAGLEVSSQTHTLDLAQNLLEMIRAQLMSDPSAKVTPAQAQQQISAAMVSAQGQINELRGMAENSPRKKMLIEQLDRSQQRLNHIRKQPSNSVPATSSGALTAAQISQLYAHAQQTIDQAREKAATMPNAKEQLKKLDEAQKRLDEARVTYGVQPALPKN